MTRIVGRLPVALGEGVVRLGDGSGVECALAHHTKFEKVARPLRLFDAVNADDLDLHGGIYTRSIDTSSA
jgi:hypothetical protein